MILLSKGSFFIHTHFTEILIVNYNITINLLTFIVEA